jgi:hypothetical protein
MDAARIDEYSGFKEKAKVEGDAATLGQFCEDFRSSFNEFDTTARLTAGCVSLRQAGIRVYDPGFMNTAVIQSRISFIDGTRGILRYRGYPIEALANKSNFLESAYLLLYGELPTEGQFKLFSNEILHHTMVHRDLEEIIGSFRFDSHPM